MGSNDESERLFVRPLVASPIEHALKRVIRVARRDREPRRFQRLRVELDRRFGSAARLPARAVDLIGNVLLLGEEQTTGTFPVPNQAAIMFGTPPNADAVDVLPRQGQGLAGVRTGVGASCRQATRNIALSDGASLSSTVQVQR
jgi:hypothetical protein